METVLMGNKSLQRDFFDYLSTMVDTEEVILTLQNIQNKRRYDSGILQKAYNLVQTWVNRLNSIQPKKSLIEIFQEDQDESVYEEMILGKAREFKTCEVINEYLSKKVNEAKLTISLLEKILNKKECSEKEMTEGVLTLRELMTYAREKSYGYP